MGPPGEDGDKGEPGKPGEKGFKGGKGEIVSRKLKNYVLFLWIDIFFCFRVFPDRSATRAPEVKSDLSALLASADPPATSDDAVLRARTGLRVLAALPVLSAIRAFLVPLA